MTECLNDGRIVGVKDEASANVTDNVFSIAVRRLAENEFFGRAETFTAEDAENAEETPTAE